MNPGAGLVYADVKQANGYSITGDFTLTVYWDQTSLGSGPDTRTVLYANIGGSANVYIGVFDSGGRTYKAKTVSAGEATSSTSDTSGRFRIKRLTGVLQCQYWNGSSWTTLKSENTGTAMVGFSLAIQNQGTGSTIVDWDNVELVDGNGDPIVIDPTGTAC